MIIGCSHIVLSSCDFESDVKQVAELGYKLKFSQHKIPVHHEKKSYLRKYQEKQSMALFTSDSGPFLEISQYNNSHEGDFNPYSILFRGKGNKKFPNANSAILNLLWSKSFNALNSEHYYMQGQHQIISYSNNGEFRHGIEAISCQVNNLELAQSFFHEALNLKVKKTLLLNDSCKATCLEYKGLVDNWSLKLVLWEDASMKNKKIYLDDMGLNILSFLSSNLDRDRLSLLSYPFISSTGIMHFNINKRKLKVDLFQLMDGAFIELIQFI